MKLKGKTASCLVSANYLVLLGTNGVLVGASARRARGPCHSVPPTRSLITSSGVWPFYFALCCDDAAMDVVASIRKCISEWDAGGSSEWYAAGFVLPFSN